MHATKLLIVEDDATAQLMLETMLSEYQLTMAQSGEAGLDAVARDTPDIIVLDINLPGIDGYETCRKLRELETTRETPIVFLTSYTDLQDRLLAYGAGGNDYISKPFDITELLSKIEFHSRMVHQNRASGETLSNTHRLLIDVQTSAAKLQSISRFIQTTLFCHDIETLLQQFFKTAREMGTDCVLRIESSSGVTTRSCDGGISALEEEILNMSGNMKRIHAFGHDRAIFRWSHATLLTRKVGDMIDTLAIFMDALEAGIKAVDTESTLLQQVVQLEAENSILRDRVTELSNSMSHEIKDAILALGLVSALDIEDEDKLHEIIDRFNQQINEELKTLSDNNQVIKNLITELRTPPPELAELMQEDEDDGVLLF